MQHIGVLQHDLAYLLSVAVQYNMEMLNLQSHHTHQPFLVTLEALLIQSLRSNNHSSPWFRSFKGVFVDPPFEDTSKTTFAYNTVRPEVSCGYS